MKNIIIGNIISFLAASLMAGIGLIKSKNKILTAQCIQFALYAIGNLFLGGITGAVSNLVSMIRNLRCINRTITTREKFIWSAILVALSAAVNRAGIIGWLPIAASVLYTFFLSVRSEIKLKLAMICCQLMWVIYDATIHGYVNVAFDIITIVSTTIGIMRILKGHRQTPEE